MEAWGSPAVVVACGAARPAELRPGSDALLFNAGDVAGPFYLRDRGATTTTYTIVDRAPIVTIAIPTSYPQYRYLLPLVALIGRALPGSVCSTSPDELDADRLCTHRR